MPREGNAWPPAPVKPAPVRLSYSSISTFQLCPRKYAYSYIERKERIGGRSRPLGFGSAFHAAQEALWGWSGESTDPGRLSGARKAWADAAASEQLSFEDTLLGEVLLIGYAARWDDLRLSFHGTPLVECKVELPVLRPDGTPDPELVLVCVFDVVTYDADGSSVVVEHKCLTGDAELFNQAEGLYRTAQDLVGKPVILWTGHAWGAASVTIGSVQPCVAVGLRSGRTLRVSSNHPVLTPAGWAPAGGLTVGCPVMHSGSGTSGDGVALSDDQIAWLGYMLGDGTFPKGDDRRAQFTKRPGPVLDDFVIVSKWLGFQVACYSSPKRSAAAVQCRGEFPLALETEGFRSANKRVPPTLMGMDRAQTRHFLRALWSTDGHFYSSHDHLYVGYSSRSQLLCSDVQRLLHRLGIETRLSNCPVVYKGAKRDYWQLRVVSREAKRRMRELLLGSAKYVTLPAVRDGVHCNDSAGLDAVVSVEHLGDLQTYSVEVPGAHTFELEGVLTHNTTKSDVSPGAAYWGRLDGNLQASIYWLAAADHGRDVQCVLWDVIRAPLFKRADATPLADREYYKRPPAGSGFKPGDLKPGQRTADETADEFAERIMSKVLAEPNAYFGRQELARSDDELDRVRMDLWAVGRQMVHAVRTGAFPRNLQSCNAFNEPCAYLPVCRGEATIDDPTLYRLRVREETKTPW